jgi:hypothetical protein
VHSSGLLVKPDVARAQLDAEAAKTHPVTVPQQTLPTPGGPVTNEPTPRQPDTKPPVKQPTRYHGSVTLDPTRVGRDASRIADEVIAHLAGLVGASVKVTLELEAEIPAGTPDHVVRTVTENSRTLKFNSHGFEQD